MTVSIFRPMMYQKNIYTIDYNKLKQKKIEMLIFDLDNTLLKVGNELPDNETIELFKRLKKDFKIVIASNNIQKKVGKIAEILGCDYLYSLMKPTKRIKKFIDKKYNIDYAKIAIIGDQVMTDIFVGNRIGLFTVLVDPLGQKDYKITFLNRYIEKRIMNKIKIKKGEYYEE